MTNQAQCGFGLEHCCYVNGQPCPLLRDNGLGAVGRRFVCTAREKAGSWSRAHDDPEYQAVIAQFPADRPYHHCNEWPPKGVICQACGQVGR